ncbi:hypothetical protein N0V83_004137 [Neocucurbitaria cava]|uniref:Bromo domain-containing protein n=1 Tax=Neocucurbitaria cava TaxID=798079 RepID=A0A9W8YDL6_9PLEO|nr:hypothetical protein N0V83_004137 [Neocucurbitaria cava]
MESAAKRKAANAAVGDSDGRPAKRQKVPAETNANSETVESTTTQGLKFLESLKQAKDKTGRPISSHFLTLPSKGELPDYYVHIKLPIAIDTIEDKLNNGEYTSLAQVESDCKRLVNNAKAYNDKKSIVYEDAERLRKTASNWMVKHNPAYRDGNYVAVATPIPGEDNSAPGKPIPRIASTPRAVHTPVATPDTSERPRRAAAAAQSATPAPSKLRHSASAAPDEDDDNPDYAGKSFQQAQEQIIREIIDYEDGGLQIFLPFQNLPSRSLKDYYQLIKDPMSLTGVQKKVRGVVGRDAPTGHTLFKSWDAFENAMSLIWTNARIYNEDGSDIYNLSLELEEIFHKKLREAKAKVDEPPQPKLKLNMSSGAAAPKQQLKLKLRQSPGSDRNTPARNSATPGVIVDGDALQRQQRHVLDSMNGNNRSSRPTSAGKAGTPSVSSNPFTGPSGGAATISALPSRTAASPALNGVKQDVQSPALSAIRPASTRSDSQDQRLSVPAQTPLPVMAPPHTIARPASGSPLPNGLSQQPSAYSAPYQQPNYYAPPAAPRVDNFRKVPLKNIDEALIPKITLNTHPALNLAKPWSVDVFANKQKTAHSATIFVSPTNSYLQITPKVPIALTSRLYRLFVTVNGNRTLEVNRVPVTAGINGSSPGPGYEGGKKKGEPVFEAKLVGGVNRIEVEIVAEKEHKGGNSEKDQIETEKCTIFLHLVRQSSY